MTTVTPPSTAADTAETIPLHLELSKPIILSETLKKSTSESTSFKYECSEIQKRVEKISQMLRTIVRLSTSPTPIYDRPIRRVASDVSRNVTRAFSLVRKIRRRNFFYRLVNLITAADFRKVWAQLDTSIANLQWLISLFNFDGNGIDLSLPPIASNDPILAWVWSFTTTVQLSGQLSDRIEASNELASIANDSDRNKRLIVEEGGIPVLIRFLKESVAPEAQIAAVIAVFNLINVKERVRVVVNCCGIGFIVNILNDSCMRVQIRVSNLIARMAELDELAKEGFARENVIRPLVSILSFETFLDEVTKNSIHSIVQICKEKEKMRLSSMSSLSMSYYEGSSRGGRAGAGQTRKEREMESDEVKRELKVNCARALGMLAKDSIENSRRITETKGLLCLAKLIEKEDGDLRVNCLMTIMEITLAAESNDDLRRSVFKSNSPAAKAVVEQLLTVIKESDNSMYKIPAIRSIGSLSRTFPARETRVIEPLVEELSSKDHEVGIEAAIALGKFVCPDNYLRQEHANTIIEFNAVIPLMRLLRNGERAQKHGLVLLCYLAIHASDSEALEKARVLTALEGADRTMAAQDMRLRGLIIEAIRHLDFYRADIHPLRQSSLRF